MIKKSEDKSCLFIDTNIALSHALRLQKDGIKTWYYLPDIYHSGDPLFSNQISAQGFPLEKVETTDLKSIMEKAGMIFYPDNLNAGEADGLRKAGRAVFGPSSRWVEAEQKRSAGFELLEGLGVDVPDYEVVHGLEEAKATAEEMLNGLPFIIVKIDKCKANLSTFKATSVEELEIMIQQGRFGPYIEDIEIILQHPAEGEEIGCDLLFNGHNIIQPYLYTLDCCGRWVDWSGWDELLIDKILPSLTESDYRGNISFEGFWDGSDLKVTDICSRMPLPFGNVYTVALENYGEVIWAVANGLEAKNEVLSEYNFMLYLFSVDENLWRPLRIPGSIMNKATFRRTVKYGKTLFYIPGDDLITSLVGSGDDPESALEDAYGLLDGVEVADSYFDGIQVRTILEKIKKLNQMEDERFHF